MPETYALTARVRREASATSTSLTGTPSRAANCIRDVRNGPSAIGVNLLKTGSTSTGSTNDSSTTSPAAPTAPIAHHHRGAKWVTVKKPARASPPMTAPTAHDLSRSIAHAPQVWVEMPYSTTIECRQAANGSVTI